MKLFIDHFDVDMIAKSGQCFRIVNVSPGEYRVIAFGRVLYVKECNDGSRCYEFSCDEAEFDSIWRDYFDLSTDYGLIEKKIMSAGDEHLKEAYRTGNGIRILKQDLWEIIITFIISQNNNIPRIRNSVEALCKAAGLKAEGARNGEILYRFPGPCELDVDVFKDSSLGLGYRNVYLRDMFLYARENPEWLNGLHKLSYADARESLLARKGIGPKVADCISLFGLHHIEAFPIDTHVKALLAKYYKDGFNHEYFAGVEGIIQQYLFYFEIFK